MHKDIRIDVREHRDTKLLMALSADLPGFVVHAHSDEEMEAKLPLAIKSFLKASGITVERVEVFEEEVAAGYWPPTYIAKGYTAEAA